MKDGQKKKEKVLSRVMVARDGKGNAVVAHRGNVTWRDVARRGGVEEDLMTGHVLGGTTVDPEGNDVIMPFLW